MRNSPFRCVAATEAFTRVASTSMTSGLPAEVLKRVLAANDPSPLLQFSDVHPTMVPGPLQSVDSNIQMSAAWRALITIGRIT